MRSLALAAVAAVLALAAPGRAATPIDFTQPMLDEECKPQIPEATGPAKSAASDKATKPTTLYDVAANSLLLPDQFRPQRVNQGTDPDRKRRQYDLWVKIAIDKHAALDAEEIALLKLAIEEVQPPLVLGRALDLIDPDPKKPSNCPAAEAKKPAEGPKPEAKKP
jgi:hypothetical protein